MRILLLGDASNFHFTLAKGLRRLGQEVDVCSDGGLWMHTDRDFSLPIRHSGKIGGLKYWFQIKKLLKEKLHGYDVVSQASPLTFPLRPQRNRYLFDRLKGENENIFLTNLGTDSYYVRECLKKDSCLRYSEFAINGQSSPLTLAEPNEVREWTSPEMCAYDEYFYSRIDGAVSSLYEYYKVLQTFLPTEKRAYGGIPINLNEIKFTQHWQPGEKVKIFLGRHSYRQLVKGSDLLGRAAEKVANDLPDKCKYILVEDRPFREFSNLLTNSHLVLDQIYSYTPATSALMAMAMGKTVISGGESEYYDFIGEAENRPIINAALTCDELEQQIRDVVLHPEILAENAATSRAFVQKHNDCEVVARRFLNFWQSKK